MGDTLDFLFEDEGEMGIAADTIETIYRSIQEQEADVQRKKLERMKALVVLHEKGGNVVRLAEDVMTGEVFEAVRLGELTAHEGGVLLYLARCAEWEMLPWPVRFLGWFLGRRRWW